MRTYYITTDSGTETIEAHDLCEALAQSDVPKYVRDVDSFERWLDRVGGYGNIEVDGEIIAHVRS